MNGKILNFLIVTFILCVAAVSLCQSQVLTPSEIINGAISPFQKYSDGYGNPGASGLGYVSVLKLEIGRVRKSMDPILEDIVDYDRAETQGTYIGQINMITVSSFNGLNGLIWGYDLARNDRIAKNKQKSLFQVKNGVRMVPVYSMQPLLDAGRQLFGTNTHRRFNLLPGAHVKAAAKSTIVMGPGYAWSALGLAIASNRTKAADLFVEDAGKIQITKGDNAKKAILAFSKRLQKHIAESIVKCSRDSHVHYKKIFIGYKLRWIPAGYVANALVVAPYVVLAKKAIPVGKKPADLLHMTLSQWLSALNLKYLR